MSGGLGHKGPTKARCDPGVGTDGQGGESEESGPPVWTETQIPFRNLTTDWCQWVLLENLPLRPGILYVPRPTGP